MSSRAMQKGAVYLLRNNNYNRSAIIDSAINNVCSSAQRHQSGNALLACQSNLGARRIAAAVTTANQRDRFAIAILTCFRLFNHIPILYNALFLAANTIPPSTLHYPPDVCLGTHSLCVQTCV